MSTYDENGNGQNQHLTNAAAGVECAECYTTIDRTDDGKLYELFDDYLCRNCVTRDLTVHKYGKQGLCDICNDGIETLVFPVTDFDKSVQYHKRIYHRLCLNCFIERLNTISADDPADD